MATKKSSNSKTTKTTTKKDEIVNANIAEETKDTIGGKDSVDLNKIYSLIESLQTQVKELKDENEFLKSEKIAVEEVALEETAQVEAPVFNTDDPNRKITIYHTQELSHNLSTYIKLSTTKRNFRKAGEVARFSLNDFEELVGEYRRFFERGILAISIKDADFAELYDLPVWDEKNKTVYTSKILEKVSSYNAEQLRSFYNNLSVDSKHSFLAFWLGKVYSKEAGFYDVEKIGWLKNIANTNLFDAILLEMNTNNARGNSEMIIDADKLV